MKQGKRRRRVKFKLSYKSSRVISNDLGMQTWAFCCCYDGLHHCSESRWEEPSFLQFPPSDSEPSASACARLQGFLRQVEQCTHLHSHPPHQLPHLKLLGVLHDQTQLLTPQHRDPQQKDHHLHCHLPEEPCRSYKSRLMLDAIMWEVEAT